MKAQILKMLNRLPKLPVFVRRCDSDFVISEELMKFMLMALPTVEDIVCERGRLNKK
jgi:hypothetical protein